MAAEYSWTFYCYSESVHLNMFLKTLKVKNAITQFWSIFDQHWLILQFGQQCVFRFCCFFLCWFVLRCWCSVVISSATEFHMYQLQNYIKQKHMRLHSDKIRCCCNKLRWCGSVTHGPYNNKPIQKVVLIHLKVVSNLCQTPRRSCSVFSC